MIENYKGSEAVKAEKGKAALLPAKPAPITLKGILGQALSSVGIDNAWYKKYKSSKTVSEANMMASSIGVIVDYGNDLSIANLMNKMLLEVFNDEGFAFSKVILNNSITDVAQWNPSENALEINPTHFFWKNVKRIMAVNKESNITSSSSVFHMIWHEHSHYKIYSKSVTKYKILQNISFTNFDKSWIVNHVSSNATKNGLEYVAEIEAGIKAGRSFTDDAMDLYKKLIGD